MEEKKRILIEKFLDIHVGFDLIKSDENHSTTLTKKFKNKETDYFIHYEKNDILVVNYDDVILTLFSVFNIKEGTDDFYDIIKNWVFTNYNINAHTITGGRLWKM